MQHSYSKQQRETSDRLEPTGLEKKYLKKIKIRHLKKIQIFLVLRLNLLLQNRPTAPP